MQFDGPRHLGLAATSLLVPAIVTVSVLVTPAPVRAEEPTNPLTSMFGLFDAKPGTSEDAIDYRPRAPLVVPPTRDLPEPKQAVRDPAWPKDKDAEARRRAAIDARRPAPKASAATESEAPQQDVQANATPAQPDEQERGCLLNATGPQSCFNILQTVFGGESSKEAKPGGEPPRKLLIEPPPGYRTATVVPKNDDDAKADEEPDGIGHFLKALGIGKSADK